MALSWHNFQIERYQNNQYNSAAQHKNSLYKQNKSATCFGTIGSSSDLCKMRLAVYHYNCHSTDWDIILTDMHITILLIVLNINIIVA
jgi:hypothetical protein